MSAMLLSIKPRYAKVILEGEKQYEFPKEIWEITKTAAGITKKFYFSYYAGKDKAMAFKLKDVVIYEKPKALSDYGIRQAPQSFVYL